jgi:hypothetical protein
VGYIKDPDGEGLQHAIVTVKGTDLRTESGDDGRYKFRSVHSGDAEVQVSCYGYRSGSARTFVISGISDDQALDLNLTLTRLTAMDGVDRTSGKVDVSGRVVDKNTNLVENASVSMYGNGTVRTGSDGAFSFRDVNPGRAAITVEAANFTITEYVLFVQNGTGPFDIVLDTVAGVVNQDETDGQVTLQVRLKDRSGGGISGGMVSVNGKYAMTDAVGYASFQLPAAFKMTIQGSAYGQGSGHFISYFPEGEGSAELVLPGEAPEAQKGDREDIKGRMSMCNSISSPVAKG